MLYGANVWDPVLITAQIVSVQCLFYIVLALLQAVLIGARFGPLTIAYIFSYQTMSASSAIGRRVILSHSLNALAAATHLPWLVERAKKCLDFSSTCYIWHLVFCACYGGFPTSLTWWLVNVGGFIATSLLGEWLCVRREMQEIPLSSRGGGGGGGPPGRKASGAAGVCVVGGGAAGESDISCLLVFQFAGAGDGAGRPGALVMT